MLGGNSMEFEELALYNHKILEKFIPFENKDYGLLNPPISVSVKSPYNFENMIPLNSFEENFNFLPNIIRFSPKILFPLKIDFLYINKD